MATWSFTLTPGGDITNLVDVQSIARTRRLFTELRPNVNKLEYTAIFDSSLLASLLSNDPVEIAVTKDSVAYFTGVVSPNYRVTVKDGRKFIQFIAEDYTLSRLGKTITTPIAYAGYSVCNPSSTSTSLVHAIATGAGVTLATSLPTISSTVPYVVVLTDEKKTWGQLLSDILFEYGYVYQFDADGKMSLAVAVNTGTITTTGTLTTAAGSANIRGEMLIEKSPEKYDDVRIRYDVVEQKTGIVVFQDTTGGTDTQPCTIPLNATGDANGKDYYPLTSKDGEVFSAWNSPDRYNIWVVTSASMDVAYETGITVDRALTNYYRKCSFGYKNTAVSVKNITKLRITGNAYVIASKNVARYSAASAKNLYEYEAKYIFSKTPAENLAKAIAQYYKYSDIRYKVNSSTVYTPGQYVLVADAVYAGISNKCRVIGITERENKSGVIEYELEGVADFVSVTVTTEGDSVPISETPTGSLVAPTNNVSSVSFTSSQNADGSVKVTASWSYTQGADVADLAYIYYKGDITGAPSAFDYASDMAAVRPIDAGEWSQDFPGSTGGTGGAPIRYRFGVIAARGALLHSGGAVTPTGWDDKTLVPVIQDIDFNLYDKSFTSYEGSGVFRRAVRVSGDGVRWLNAPDGGSDVEIARIKRLGSSGLLIDVNADFDISLVNKKSTWGSASTISASNCSGPKYIQLDNGQLRIAYRRSSDGYIVERIFSGSAWGSESVVNNASSSAPAYVQLSNGELRIAYIRTSDNYLVERIWSGSAWGAESVVNNAASYNPTYISLLNGELRIIYTKTSSAGSIVERIWSGSVWGPESVINSASSGLAQAFQLRNGEMRIAYTRFSDNYLVERIWSGSAWSAESVVNSSASQEPSYIQLADDELRIAYRRNSDSYIVERIWSGSAWGAESVLVDTPSANANYVQLNDGQLRVCYVTLSPLWLYEKKINRYAPIASYATGLWTPRVYGTTTEGVGTYSAQSGNYTLVGNVCFFQAYIGWSAHTGTGSLRIDGLPFTCSASLGSFFPTAFASYGLGYSAGYSFQAYVTQSSKYITVLQLPSGGGTPVGIPVDTAVTWLMLSGFYFIA